MNAPAALLERAADLARDRTDERALIGIAGPPAAGKSTVAGDLVDALGDRAALVGMDGLHLDDEVLYALGRRHRKGAPDTFDVAGLIALLDRLRHERGSIVYAPRFDRPLELSRAGAVPVGPEVDTVVVEGNYLLHTEGLWSGLRAVFDEVWYLEVPVERRRSRLISRRFEAGDDGPAARRWVEEVDMANARTVEAGREHADLVVPVDA